MVLVLSGSSWETEESLCRRALCSPGAGFSHERFFIFIISGTNPIPAPGTACLTKLRVRELFCRPVYF